MKLTTKGRYAVTAMLDLALRAGAGPVALADIARRQDISLPYLEQLFAKLRHGGLVRSYRGPGGGYELGRAAQDISMADIIGAVDEAVTGMNCSGTFNCQGEQRCLTHHLWATLSGRIHTFLSGITLANLVVRKGVLEVARRQDRRTDAAPAGQLVTLHTR